MANNETTPNGSAAYEWLLFAGLTLFVPALWVCPPAGGFYPALWQVTHLRHLIMYSWVLSMMGPWAFLLAFGTAIISLGVLTGDLFLLFIISRKIISFSARKNKAWGHLGAVIITFAVLGFLSRKDIYGSPRHVPNGSQIAGWFSFNELRWWAPQ